MSKNSQSKTRHFTDFAPNHWFKNRMESSLWVTGYRALRVPDSYLQKELTLDLLNVRIIILRGNLNYLDASAARIEIITDSEWRFDATNIAEKTTIEGVYVLILSPFDIDGAVGNEACIREKVQETIGLLITLYGRNIAFQHLFDNVIELAECKSTVASPSVENPFFFPSVELNTKEINLFKSAAKAIKLLEKNNKSRILLALRWFRNAAFDDDGVSSFIKYWVAIETLAMPNTTNIKPINDILSVAYKIEFDEAKKFFLVGRLLKLRSEIVHNGRIIPINSNLTKYMASLFADLLCIKLGLRFEKRAQSVLSEPDFDLPSLLGITY